jgi:hypothetical protein
MILLLLHLPVDSQLLYVESEEWILLSAMFLDELIATFFFILRRLF